MNPKIEVSYSNRANPRRGYHDYEAILTFVVGTDESLQRETAAAYRDVKAKTNFWAYGPTRLSSNSWLVNFGYDSGD